MMTIFRRPDVGYSAAPSTRLKSDGTEAGTTMVKDVYLGSRSSLPQGLTR
jgi:hypothetical protein